MLLKFVVCKSEDRLTEVNTCHTAFNRINFVTEEGVYFLGQQSDWQISNGVAPYPKLFIPFIWYAIWPWTFNEIVCRKWLLKWETGVCFRKVYFVHKKCIFGNAVNFHREIYLSQHCENQSGKKRGIWMGFKRVA